jgi:hypothetical protein
MDFRSNLEQGNLTRNVMTIQRQYKNLILILVDYHKALVSRETLG